MLSKSEMRVLYLLKKHGGAAKLSELTQAMHRLPAPRRAKALANCEEFGFISSAKTPPTRGRGGPGGLEYWLTPTGTQQVHELITDGLMTDPSAELRAGPKKACTL